MGVTIRQIAEAAGVSRGTVDRALNNRGRVNPEVAERIFEIAREMNYQPKRKKKVYNQGNAINRENIQGSLRKSIREPILSALISESMPWHIPAICPHFRERKIRSDLL